MRDANRALVLAEVARRGAATRAGLAAATGLTKTSVSSIAAELLAARLLDEDGPQRAGDPGRPGSALVLARDGVAGLGLAVEPDGLSACVADLAGRVRVRHVEVVDLRRSDPGPVVDRLARLAAACAADARALGLVVVGTAVAVPGPVDPGTRVVLRAPNLGWSGVPLRDLLAGRVPDDPLGVSVDNEADLAALAELRVGAGAGWGDFVLLSGETGVGAGVVVAGRLFRGAHGRAGEIGHLSLDPRGAPCSCGGRGCVETWAGQDALLRAAELPAGPAGRRTGESPVAPLVARLEAGDDRALATVAAAGDRLGRGAAALVTALDPDTVALGGAFAALAPWLVDPLSAGLLEAAPLTRAAPPVVAVSGLGPDAAVRGAAGAVTATALARPGLLLARG